MVLGSQSGGRWNQEGGSTDQPNTTTDLAEQTRTAHALVLLSVVIVEESWCWGKREGMKPSFLWVSFLDDGSETATCFWPLTGAFFTISNQLCLGAFRYVPCRPAFNNGSVMCLVHIGVGQATTACKCKNEDGSAVGTHFFLFWWPSVEVGLPDWPIGFHY